jgi:hypothetical protein
VVLSGSGTGVIVLSSPTTAAAEEEALNTLCANRIFQPYRDAWLQAYRHYRRHRGSGFAVTAVKFPAEVTAAQKELYRNRRNSEPFRSLRETVLKGCSRCGSPATGHLDHHLPESGFSEFSVLMANLVPTCGHCNSGAKQAKGTGPAWPERFLHPYFDHFAAKPLWRVTVDDPVAVTFTPRPEPSLGSRLAKLVQYNLDNLLGWQFANHQTNFWSSLPAQVARRAGAVAPSMVTLDDTLADLRFFVTSTEGVNGWKAALLRGIRSDPNIRVHLVTAAASLPKAV